MKITDYYVVTLLQLDFFTIHKGILIFHTVSSVYLYLYIILFYYFLLH